jgi:hypothetical protein
MEIRLKCSEETRREITMPQPPRHLPFEFELLKQLKRIGDTLVEIKDSMVRSESSPQDRATLTELADRLDAHTITMQNATDENTPPSTPPTSA